MKHTDDYDAKYKIWAKDRKVYPMPRIANLPKFASQKFDSYAEHDAFSQWLFEELAKAGGAKWTK